MIEVNLLTIFLAIQLNADLQNYHGIFTKIYNKHFAFIILAEAKLEMPREISSPK